jgi:hypothetical protein
VPYDEGWFVAAAERMAKGQKIYTDFLYLYNPGSLLVNRLAMGLLGTSILATRMLALVNSLVAIWIIHLISGRLKLSKLTEILTLGVYVFWGPGQINFGWPVMWCLTAGLACGLWIWDKKYRWAGVAAGLTFVCKQNFGMAIVLICLVYLRWEIRRLAAGWGVVMLAMMGYLWLNGSLTAYISQIWYFTVDRILVGGALASPWPWEFAGPAGYKLIKTGLYLTPLVIAIWAFGKSRSPEAKFLPLLAMGYYMFSIRPTTDFIHLAPLLAVTGPVMASARPNRWLSLGLGILLICGVYKAVWGRYYRWNTPLVAQNVWVNHPKVRLFTDETAARSIWGLSSYFETNLSPEKNLFVYSFSPVWYVILGKANPTKYDYVHSGVTLANDEKQIISDLQAKNVSTILTDHEIAGDRTPVANFISENFEPSFRVNEYTVWRR